MNDLKSVSCLDIQPPGLLGLNTAHKPYVAWSYRHMKEP